MQTLERITAKLDRPQRARTTITMEHALLDRIDALAADLGESRSHTIALLSEHALEAVKQARKEQA